MNFRESFSKFRDNKGLYQFVIRMLIFFGIVVASYLLVFLWLRHTPFFIKNLQIGEIFYFPWLSGLRKTDFLNAAAFAVIAFLVWNRDSLKNIGHYKRSGIQTFVFAVLAFLSIVSHYLLKYWIGLNPEAASGAALFFTLLKYLLVLLFLAFAALAVFNLDFFRDFFMKYWKSVLVFLVIGVLYFFLIQFFQLIWYQLSYFVTIVLRFLLSLTFPEVFFSPGSTTTGPRLGAAGFNVGISNECSGIDSLLLFLSLYTLLLVLDWKRLNIKRMLILLIPGIIGTIAYNILRIYLLMLVGIFIDPKFAVDVFHTNIGWILFLVFFIIFWHFGSKWVYKKK